jgi:glycosyltransferase involved in cell wall biosynthesis
MTPPKKGPKVIALIFTANVSLRQWLTSGLLDREKELYESLLTANHLAKVYWFTYGSSDADLSTLLHKNIVIIPPPRVFSLSFLPYLYSFILPLVHFKVLKQCDLIKTNQMWGSWTGVIAKFIHHKPLLVRTGYTSSLFHQHSPWWKRKLIYTIERIVYYFADAAVVTSRADAAYLKQMYRIKSLTVVPNAIDTDAFSPQQAQTLRDIIFVGRLVAQKRVALLLQAISNTPYSVTIIGSGNQKADLVNFVRTRNLNVEFIDSIPNSKLPRLLNQHRLFVLPSLLEGNPKSLMEAMSAGLGCVVCAAPGITQLVTHLKSGFLVKGTATSLRNGIEYMLTHDKERKKMGQTAREIITSQASLSIITKKELAIYQQLILLKP